MTGILKKIGFFAVFMVLFSVDSHGSESTRLFLDGLKAYQNGQYEKAIQKLSDVADGGVTNGKLFYNLGNAYLKNGDLGFAILWYERAKKIIPNDPDLKFNLDYARSLLKDMTEDKGNSIYRILFFWKHLLSAEVIKWAAIILNAVFWMTIMWGVMMKKRPPQIIPGIILIIALIFTATAMYDFYEHKFVKHAVVVSKQVAVRSGFSEDATELFVLHAGTKLKVEKQQDDFYRIYFSKGKIGWLAKSSVGII